MKLATAATTVLLIVVSLAHAVRVLFVVPVTVAGAVIPLWISVVGTVVPAALAFGLWRARAPVFDGYSFNGERGLRRGRDRLLM